MSSEERADRPVTVDEWAAIERKRISAYVKSWKNSQKANPNQYVEKMTLGEWDEDYAIWDDVE